MKIIGIFLKIMKDGKNSLNKNSELFETFQVSCLAIVWKPVLNHFLRGVQSLHGFTLTL